MLGDWRLLDGDTRQPKVSAVIGAVIADEDSDEDSDDNNAEFDMYEFKMTI